MSSHQTALVLGASGGIGGEVAKRLLARGWHVRGLKREPHRLSDAEKAWGIEWIQGDAMSAADVARAAQGAGVIVHAVNPAGFRNWETLVLPMLQNTIDAARATGARIVLPGAVFNFGPDAMPEPDENSPQRPVTSKGRIRVEMERRLRNAAAAGTPALILRAGSFFGPRASSSWFAQGLIKPGKPVTSVAYPGTPGVGHQWAYVPDVAETMARLLDHAGRLEDFAVFHMEGHWDPDGTRMVAAIRQAAGDPAIKLRRFPWTLVRLLSPFAATFRGLLETRYLWTTPLHMGNARLKEFLGEEPHTPLDVAVRATLMGLGCAPREEASGRFSGEKLRKRLLS